MGIMQFNVPDDVKEAFEAAYKGADADAIVAELLRKAAAERARPVRTRGFRERIAQFHAQNSKTYTDEQIRCLREEGRP